MPSVNQPVSKEPAIDHKKVPVMKSRPASEPYKQLEPPLQRKKKPVPTNQTTNVNDNQDNYVLLGSTEKFSSNVVYKPKPVSHSVEVTEAVVDEPPVSPPPAPRPNPAPAVRIDTGAPPNFSKSRQHKANTSNQPQVNGVVKKVNQPSQAVKKSTVTQTSPAGKPNQADTNTAGQKTTGHKATCQKVTGHAAALQKGIGHVAAHQKAIGHVAAHQKATGHDAALRKAIGHVEAHQKAIEHAVAHQKATENEAAGKKVAQPAEDKAPAEYAMQYQAGVAPKRNQGPKRRSEYQIQYAWKNQISASPMLNAEQVVYKSSTQLVPQKASFSKTTEYRRQFHPWQIPSSPAPSGLKLSKSMDAVNALADHARPASPDKLDPAGVEKVTDNSDPRLLQQSLNPQRLHFPHGPKREVSTEYAANFATPQQFEYERGAWKAAADSKAAAVKSTGSWFTEVVELRNRAEEYKRRARGTHFSKQHMAQLLAQQAQLWDTASTSSVLSALSLEQSNAARGASPVPQPVRPAGKKTAWGEDREPRDVEDAQSMSTDRKSVNSEVDELAEPEITSRDEQTPSETSTLSPASPRPVSPPAPLITQAVHRKSQKKTSSSGRNAEIRCTCGVENEDHNQRECINKKAKEKSMKKTKVKTNQPKKKKVPTATLR